MSEESEFTFSENLSRNQEDLRNSLREASKRIAPVWPLENFVAVNPYLGFTHKNFSHVAQELAAVGAVQMTLPASFYLEKIKAGEIEKLDIDQALRKSGYKISASEFVKRMDNKNTGNEEVKTIASIADLATEVTKKDWDRFLIGRISLWAASYFDKGQAIWAASDQKQTLFHSWKTEAEIDRTPEIIGLKGFRKLVKQLPEDPLLATQVALRILGLSPDQSSLYFHRLLLRVGGWAAYAARLDWDNKGNGRKDAQVMEFLAVLLCWEACLLQSLNDEELIRKWNDAKCKFYLPNAQLEINQQVTHNLILQEAFDLAAHRKIIQKFKQADPAKAKEITQAKAQAIFCIDVRSEVFRRNLELVDPKIETLGFAGFFAFPISFVPIGHEVGEAQCPVLLKTGPTIIQELSDAKANEKALSGRILHRQVHQVWKSFKSGAVTCFSFVPPMGLAYLPKIFTDSFGLTRPVPHPDQAGLSKKDFNTRKISLLSGRHRGERTGIPLDQQVQMAKNALKAMSLTDDFGRFVLIIGHGSTTVNNPHATGYDCGACGGHSGEANARVAAAVLNNREVKTALQSENIFIPPNTLFLACLHDTTTDEVSIFNEYDVPANRKEELQSLHESLRLATHAARTERAMRMTASSCSSVDKMIIGRSNDWSQTRPEWGLAGCSAFVVAPRERTKGINLEGKSFLHSYEWEKDQGFSVLELIMTAPMVVTSWINLQYYGSTVDNKNFGSGNKTLHNVTAGLGVLEGYSGDLRVGLPWQAIHDGEKYQHLPEKLLVIIEAPTAAINTILKKHQAVRDLVENGWIYLMVLNDMGQISFKYTGDLTWESTAQFDA